MARQIRIRELEVYSGSDLVISSDWHSGMAAPVAEVSLEGERLVGKKA